MSRQFSHTKFTGITAQTLASSGWLTLFDAQTDPRFYQHPDWFLAANRFLMNHRLEFTVVLYNDCPVALFPWQPKAHGKRYQAATHDHLTLGDVLVHPDLAESQYPALLDEALFAAGQYPWDWQMQNLPERSLIAPSVTENHGWSQRESRRSAWFDLRDEALPPTGKLKRNLKRLRGKLEAQGALRVQWTQGPADCIDAFEHFMSIEAASWKATRQQSTAIAHNPALQAFYQHLARPTFPGLTPVVTLLWLDNHCIAAQFGLQTGNTLSLLKITYAEDYSAFSPGSLLLQDVMQEARNRSLETLSLVTSPPWAERWHPHTEPVWHVTRYTNTLGGQALRTLDRIKHTARTRLRPAA